MPEPRDIKSAETFDEVALPPDWLDHDNSIMKLALELEEGLWSLCPSTKTSAEALRNWAMAKPDEINKYFFAAYKVARATRGCNLPVLDLLLWRLNDRIEQLVEIESPPALEAAKNIALIIVHIIRRISLHQLIVSTSGFPWSKLEK